MSIFADGPCLWVQTSAEADSTEHSDVKHPLIWHHAVYDATIQAALLRDKHFILNYRTPWFLFLAKNFLFIVILLLSCSNATLDKSLLFMIPSSSSSVSYSIVGEKLNLPPRYGVPGGSNGRVGARPFGSRWRKWGHHHILLIGQGCQKEREGDHTEVKNREIEEEEEEGGGSRSFEGHVPKKRDCYWLQPQSQHPTTPTPTPLRFYIYFHTHPSRQGFPFRSANSMPQTRQNNKDKSKILCVHVRVCMWSHPPEGGLVSERGQCICGCLVAWRTSK